MRPENPHIFMLTVDGKQVKDGWIWQRYLDFEAGVDALLEGLKKSGTFGHLCDSSILTPDGEIVGLKGYNDMSLEDGTFVFIKEE